MISDKEKEKYLLKEKRDTEILELIHELEKKKLSSYEEFLISWTRTQLERNWRKSLIDILKTMKKNYGKGSNERIRKIQEFANKNFWKP